jgi:hypothetical protein
MPMTMHEASRTLVKSTPELWAECSDAASLSRHLGAFGEIRITKLEPETAVAWEGDDVRGTVTLEQSGWGTRVVLRATAEGRDTPAEPEAELDEEPRAETAAEPELVPEPIVDPGVSAESAALITEPSPAPDAEPAPEDTLRPGFLARMFGFLRRSGPEPTPLGDEDPLIGLTEGGEEAASRAQAGETQPVPEPDPGPESQPAAEAEAGADAQPAAEVQPAIEVARTTEPEPATPRPPELDVLVEALDSLGTAHRRPFSRS